LGEGSETTPSSLLHFFTFFTFSLSHSFTSHTDRSTITSAFRCTLSLRAEHSLVSRVEEDHAQNLSPACSGIRFDFSGGQLWAIGGSGSG
jgi:hypothetical protein